jgi:hypothetical protein
VKLSDSQFCTLRSLAEHGPQEAMQVYGPRDMAGNRKIKLEWRGTQIVTLEKMEKAGYVAVKRDVLPRPVNAVGKQGHPRVALTISITDAGRAALAST